MLASEHLGFKATLPGAYGETRGGTKKNGGDEGDAPKQKPPRALTLSGVFYMLCIGSK